MVKTLQKCKLPDVSQGPTLQEGLSKSFLGQGYCFFPAHMCTPNSSSFPVLEHCTLVVPVLYVNLNPRDGCCLWGRAVGHDWSNLAAGAAAAIEEKTKAVQGGIDTLYQTLESISVAKITQEWFLGNSISLIGKQKKWCLIKKWKRWKEKQESARSWKQRK